MTGHDAGDMGARGDTGSDVGDVGDDFDDIEEELVGSCREMAPSFVPFADLSRLAGSLPRDLHPARHLRVVR